MKGFGIEIKNTLLDPKHVESIGPAIWLYMWLLDKITSVDEKGLGMVLGGRPVKFDEVKKKLGISQNTYTAWIEKLLAYPYITRKRTPYGNIFQVLKTHKRFANRFTQNSESQETVNHSKAEPDSQKQGNLLDSQKTGNVIKTVTLTDTKTVTKSPKGEAQPASYGDPDINAAIAFLKDKLGGSPDGTQRENRRFAKLLLDRMKRDYPDKKPIEQIQSLITLGLQEPFHQKNITSFKYLYYNTQKIIHSIKGRVNNPKVIKI